MEENGYMVGAYIVGGLSFIAIWIYAIFSCGLLVDLTIGWVPAVIGGTILGFLWPLVLIAIAGIIWIANK